MFFPQTNGNDDLSKISLAAAWCGTSRVFMARTLAEPCSSTPWRHGVESYKPPFSGHFSTHQAMTESCCLSKMLSGQKCLSIFMQVSGSEGSESLALSLYAILWYVVWQNKQS